MVAECITTTLAEDSTDEDLVAYARNGSSYAWNLLFQRHQRTFFRLAMSVVKEEHTANDVVQVALMSIYTKIDSFDGRGAFSSWANRVVYNAALMHLRSKRRRREVSFEALVPAARNEPSGAVEAFERPSPPPDQNYANKQLGEHIRRAVEQLDPKYRRVIELREFRGYTMNELGQELGLSVGGAKTRLFRARDTLRVALQRHYPEMAA